jgi:hypothetical protein
MAANATRRSSASEPHTAAGQAQVLAERAVLVPIGAGLVAGETVVAGVKDLAGRYGTRPSVERELKRYERRGASARNRLERHVRRTRTTFERELRHRRSTVKKVVGAQSSTDFTRIVLARDDLGKQSSTIGARVQQLVAGAKSRIGSVT